MKNLGTLLLILVIGLSACKKKTVDPPTDDGTTPPPTTEYENYPIAKVLQTETDLETYVTGGDEVADAVDKLADDLRADPDVDEVIVGSNGMMVVYKNGQSHGIGFTVDSAGLHTTKGGLNPSENVSLAAIGSAPTRTRQNRTSSTGTHLTYFESSKIYHWSPVDYQWSSSARDREAQAYSDVVSAAFDWYGDDIDVVQDKNNDATIERLLEEMNGSSDAIVINTHGLGGGLLLTNRSFFWSGTDDDITPDHIDEYASSEDKESIIGLLKGEYSFYSLYKYHDKYNIEKLELTSGSHNIALTPTFFKNRFSPNKPKAIFMNACMSMNAQPSISYKQFRDIFVSFNDVATYGWTEAVGTYFAGSGTRFILKHLFVDMDSTGVAHWDDDGFEISEPFVEMGRTGTVDLEFIGDDKLSNCHCPETMMDGDGVEYPVAQIGWQCWMAANLKPVGGKGECYDGDSDNCDEYGGLFTQSDAFFSGTVDWKLPSDQDWKDMESFLGMSAAEYISTGNRGTNEGRKIKGAWDGDVESGWDYFGFNAQKSGNRYASTGTYTALGNLASYWTSTVVSSNAYYRKLFSGQGGIWRQTNANPLDKYGVRLMKKHSRP